MRCDPLDAATNSIHGRWQSTAAITTVDDEQLLLLAQVAEESERRRECGLRLGSARGWGPGSFVAQPRAFLDDLCRAGVRVDRVAADEVHSIEQAALGALYVGLDQSAAVWLL